MDLLKKRPKKIKLNENINSLEFSKIKNINNIFDLFCNYNLDINKSNILKKKYNTKKNIIEVFNEEEYKMLKNFLNNNIDLEEYLGNKNILGSREGNIILEGYKKYILDKYLINFEINEVLKMSKFDTYYHLGENNDLKFCLKNLDNYIQNYENRFKYLNTIIFFYKNKEIGRLPLYIDILSEIYVYTERNLFNNFKTFININKGFLFFEYNKVIKDVMFYFYYNNEIIKFLLNDELLIYEDFEDYFNKEYLGEIKELENNI